MPDPTEGHSPLPWDADAIMRELRYAQQGMTLPQRNHPPGTRVPRWNSDEDVTLVAEAPVLRERVKELEELLLKISNLTHPAQDWEDEPLGDIMARVHRHSRSARQEAPDE